MVSGRDPPAEELESPQDEPLAAILFGEWERSYEEESGGCCDEILRRPSTHASAPEGNRMWYWFGGGGVCQMLARDLNGTWGRRPCRWRVTRENGVPFLELFSNGITERRRIQEAGDLLLRLQKGMTEF